MNLNLFGDDDDAQTSSGFSANLKMETYNSVVVTFNSIVANADDTKTKAKDTNPGDKDKSRNADDKSRNADDKGKNADDKAEGTKNIHILTQKMIVANSNSEYVVDLDEEQKKTQSTSCDYLVYVPTSLNVAKETVDAFYETNFQFKKMFGKLNMKDAAATVFMQLDLFQKFVKYANQKSRKRALQWIQQSFQDANASKQIVVNDMKNVRGLYNLMAGVNTVNLDEKGDERFVILYTTPVSTDQPVAIANSLQYLPLASKFCNDAALVPNNQFSLIISQKALNYHCSYFQLMYMKTKNNAPAVTGSFGRILNYVPPLNSKMPPGNTATFVNYKNTAAPMRYAHPSYNVEIVTNFLRGIITGNNLPNRNVLRNDNKLKPIQDKTRLYTFKSTPDYNLNYEKLLERLYYKYPCHLTPNAKVTKEEKKAMTDAALAAAAAFNGCMDAAIGASDKTKSHSIICAVAIATREFIYYDANLNGGATADTMLTRLFTSIYFGANPAVLKPYIQAHLIAYNVAPFAGAGRQLNPLIGAACAAGDAVYAAAKLAITNYVKDNAATSSKDAALAAIKKAMDSVIDNFDNFAAFAYDNDTLLSLLKYSDKAQAVDAASATPSPMTVNAANLMEKADYLKTLYKQSATKEEKSEAQQQKDEFETVHDDDLYVICGPVYFDYTWIFKQNPELIKHILGQISEKDLKELKEGWTPVEDPLTENKYHINPNPEEKSYPKMRFDNPTQMPAESTQKYSANAQGYYTYSWKEQYVPPSQAKDDNTNANVTAKLNVANDFAGRILAATNVAVAGVYPYPIARRYTRYIAYTVNYMNTHPSQKYLDSICNWKTPGYYQYECTQKNARRTGNRKWEHKYIQLMRPPTYENGVQDFTEPNLPTAYPPPLMSIVPPFRGPGNTFVIHAWIPGETFIAEDGTLNQRGCMEYMYKMMQLIFKTAEKNASDTASKKRICIKIAAIGYESQDMKSLRKINRPEDKQFIGDAFFSALRDYSMLYESMIHVTLYYDDKTQSGVKTRYDDYVGQRLSVLRKSNPLAMDTSLHLKIANMDDFFTLKWYPDTDQLSKNDLLYFVDYCSSPSAFIGNMGEWPENIEDVMDDAIKGTNPLPLLKCLSDAFTQINDLYVDRGIKEKMEYMMLSLNGWNNKRAYAMNNAFNTTINNINELCANSGDRNVADQVGSSSPMDIMVSWWKFQITVQGITALPRNAYISSFDEHVMILHNLLSNSNNVDSVIGPTAAGWANNAPSFDNPDNVNATVNLRNTSVNYGPYVVNSFAQNINNTFENAVYAYTQAKKILTLLSKMKYDEIQITKADNDKIKAALAALNAYNVKMSWSMDAKFTTAVAEGAFIPNSSALHNPFMCPALLDPKEWQFMDFDDVGVREIAGAKPVSTLLKPFIDAKIRGSDAFSSSSLTRSNALIISKQPNMSILGANFAVILENMFHRNARMQYDGKNMVFNNYAWNKEFFYKKRNDRAVLQQLTSTNESKTPDFASLMGIRASPGRCIQFPLFAVQLAMYLYQGNLADMTGMDMARLSCSLDGSMFKTNAQILWDQMMNGLKTHSQNFTVEHVLGRLGHPLTKEEYEYTARWDLPPPPPPPGTATALINAVNDATNPTIKTTNVETLKKIKQQIGANPSALYTNGVNNLNNLITLANAYNTAELDAVNGQTASLGWNAATQRESTVLYMNKMARKNGTIVNIASELTSLRPGDKIYIIDETAGNNLLTKLVPTKRQVWRVTGKPIKNATKDNIIDVPVTYAVRPYNVTSVFRDIANSSSLTVTLERFSEE
jgi:hypothetical protein